MPVPLINGFRYSWSSIEVNIGGVGIVNDSISELSYSETIERTKLKKSGSPLNNGRTRGTYDAEGSITMAKDKFQEMIAKLGDGWGEKEFEISVSYRDTNNPLTNDVLEACLFDGADVSASEGSDPVMVTLALNVNRLKLNGVYLVKEE